MEGDSAGGSAKQGRDRSNQAILPLRGKILNVERARFDKMLSSDQIGTLIMALGAGIGREEFNIEKLRYHKIVIMTDADVDGAHIRTLLLTFFYRQMPEIIEKGYLYIAQPPLYKVMRGRSERYLKDDDELETYLINEGTTGEALILADGTQIAGEDLRERVRSAAAFKQALWRLSMRANGSVVEQAAIAGALAPGASDDEAKATAARLNLIAEEGEDTWVGHFDDGNLILSREVRGVEDKAVLGRQLLASADATRLHAHAAPIRPMYIESSILRNEKAGDVPITGPISLLEAVLASGRKGMKIQRYKGLGEMNADQLWETTLDHNARTLLQVHVEDALEAGDMFSRLMGDVVEPRREFIQNNALDAQVDV